MQIIHASIPTKSRRFCSVPQSSSHATKDIYHNYFLKTSKNGKMYWKLESQLKFMCASFLRGRLQGK